MNKPKNEIKICILSNYNKNINEHKMGPFGSKSDKDKSTYNNWVIFQRFKGAKSPHNFWQITQ